MKKLVVYLIILSSFFTKGYSQIVNARDLNVTRNFNMTGRNIKGISNDTTFSGSTQDSLATNQAIKGFVINHIQAAIAGFSSTESDPIWTAASSSYRTFTQNNSLYYPRNANPDGFSSGIYKSADSVYYTVNGAPVFAYRDSGGISQTFADGRYPQITRFMDSTNNRWSMDGNSITGGSDIFGTTNNAAIRFYTNGVERLRLDSAAGNQSRLWFMQGSGLPAANIGVPTAAFSDLEIRSGAYNGISLITQASSLTGIRLLGNKVALQDSRGDYGGVIVQGTTADRSAALEVKSTVQGFIAPRMTTAQRNDIQKPLTSITVVDGGSGYVGASTTVGVTPNGLYPFSYESLNLTATVVGGAVTAVSAPAQTVYYNPNSGVHADPKIYGVGTGATLQAVYGASSPSDGTIIYNTDLNVYQYYSTDSTAWFNMKSDGVGVEGGGGSATVESFSAGNLSPLFTTSVADATTDPALSFTLTNQLANRFFAGPTSGGATAPTFRALVAGDIPSTLNATTFSGAISATNISGTNTGDQTVFGRTGNITAQSGDYTFAQIGSKPNSLVGYGIIDPVVLTTGSYSNPSWITSLAYSKISGTPTTVSGAGLTDAVTLTGTQTLTNKTISGASNTLTNIAQSSVTSLVSDLALKSPIASPTFTGTPAAPTASPGTNTTQLATTAFVTAAVGAATTGVSSFNGRTGAVTPAANDYTFAQLASKPTTIAGFGITDFNSLGDARWATISSPAFTGTPTSPTATLGTNTTQIATTAFVQAAIADATAGGGYTLPIATPSVLGGVKIGSNISIDGTGVISVSFPVTSVFGRTGAITAQSNDYTFAQIGSKPTTLAGYGITDAYTGTPAVQTITATGTSVTFTTATPTGTYIVFRNGVLRESTEYSVAGNVVTMSDAVSGDKITLVKIK